MNTHFMKELSSLNFPPFPPRISCILELEVQRHQEMKTFFLVVTTVELNSYYQEKPSKQHILYTVNT